MEFSVASEKELEILSKLSNRYSLSELFRLSRRDFFKIFTLRVGGKIVGYSVVQTVKPEAEIHWIEIFEPYRGKGFGKKLLGEILKFLRLSGFEKLYLEVSERNNTAYGIYKAFGFKEVGRRRGYYGDGDAILMEITL